MNVTKDFKYYYFQILIYFFVLCTAIIINDNAKPE